MTTSVTRADESRPTASAQLWSWRRAQALSGLLLAGFVGLHLINLPLAAFPGAYDAYQRVLRALYQSPFFEIPFVVTPLVVHIVAGVRAIARRDRAAPATWPARLHRYSAWYLLFVIAGHVLATRGASLFYGIYPEALGVAFALEWIPVFFWPYYLLLGLSGVAHLGYGLLRAVAVMRKSADRSASSKPLALGLALAALLVVLGVVGLSGALYPIDDPFGSDYAGIYREMDSPFVPDVPAAR